MMNNVLHLGYLVEGKLIIHHRSHDLEEFLILREEFPALVPEVLQMD
jgi:hypothetical protein